MDLFTVVPIFIGVVFLIVLGVVLFQISKGVAVWSNNNSQPVVSVPARVVTKRSDIDGPSMSNSRGRVSTSYFVTFELESGTRLEFDISGKEYGQLAEADKGTLTHQGTRYHGFQRSARS